MIPNSHHSSGHHSSHTELPRGRQLTHGIADAQSISSKDTQAQANFHHDLDA